VVFLLPHSCACVCLCVCLIIECLGLQVAVGGSRGRLNEFIGSRWMMCARLRRARCRLPRSCGAVLLHYCSTTFTYFFFSPFFSLFFFHTFRTLSLRPSAVHSPASVDARPGCFSTKYHEILRRAHYCYVAPRCTALLVQLRLRELACSISVPRRSQIADRSSIRMSGNAEGG